MRKLPIVLILLSVSCTYVRPMPSSIAGPAGTIHISDGGRGSALPVLFVHGNGANLTQWQAQLDHVRQTRRAVALDLRGMGKSAVPANSDYSIPAMASDVAAVADALHLKRFIIVGHSYGGGVVAAYAATHPDRIAAVVYADSAANVSMPKEAGEKFIAALRKNKDAVVNAWFAPILVNATDPVRDAVLASVHDTPVDALAGALAGLAAHDVGADVRAIKAPRLAIINASLAKNPSSFHSQFPEVPSPEMEGVSHWLMMDKPDEFNRILDEFLATVR
ncbi:MAG TPA: alpha/beta hydrolase [Thermoanaerobaculia bacterium]|nr:alpha/beta hydrolase [Thermoanaerobaculia bacterium]